MSLNSELHKLKVEIEGYAKEYGLDFFDTIYEVVDADTINALAAQEGFPVRYPHWRFGMSYDQLSQGYEWGLSKIYEMVINTNPSYAYLMSSNSFVSQKMVMAHVYGHVDFFKNNYWFSKTNRKMLDEMANHAVKIRRYMDRYGQDRVESFIDGCLSLDNLIDPHLPFAPKVRTHQRTDDEGLSDDFEAPKVGKLKNERGYMEKFINPPEFLESERKKQEAVLKQAAKFPPEPQKDVLLFLIDHAPMDTWQQEVLRIVRDEAYYFVPQMQTKIMNEGWASYWHSKILTSRALHDDEVVDFCDHHAGVMAMQPGKINPYKIGIELFRDIEDRWNRGAFGKEYEECESLTEKLKWDKKLGLGKQKIFEVRRVCNDVTFIDEYLTPEFCERLKLYTYEFNRRTQQYEIVDRDFRKVKEKILAGLTNFGSPVISVIDGNYQNRGELLLWHKYQGIDLDPKYAQETLTNLEKIWKRPVHIETQVEGQKRILSVIKGEYQESNG
jgi:stage V sporulation protein R